MKLSDPNERLAVGPVDPWQFSAAKSANYRLMRRRAAYRAGKSLLHFYQGLPAHVADVLYKMGLRLSAEGFLWRLYCASPYDDALGEYLANWLYEHHQHEYAAGTIERGKFLMHVLELSYPSPRVTAAYFDNLQSVMTGRLERTRPGQVILGIGAGRCGSTTLAGILHSIEGAVSTHENPPLVRWEPSPVEVQFHLRRFEIFGRYVPLIADCAHWWINLLEKIFSAFPDSKAIGVSRDTDECVQSWMRVSPADVNHFVAGHNWIWPTDRWDPLYPHYELPPNARQNPTQAKETLTRRYIEEYNNRMRLLASRLPDRILLLSTHDLDSPHARARISEFLQLSVGTDQIRHNVGLDSDPASVDGFYF